MISKPMLSGKVADPEKIKFPTYATPKLDGIRCLKINGRALSRKLIDIPNKYIQSKLKDLPDGLDGELIVEGKTFNECQSEIMSEEGEPNFSYYVFDYVSNSNSVGYLTRIAELSKLSLPDFCKKLIPKKLSVIEEFYNYESSCLDLGYEGIMLRSESGPYKCGRSTEREGYLLKFKRFEDSDAVIVGFEPLLENNNPAEKDLLGNAKRSQKKDGMVLSDMLGSLQVRDIHSNVEFSIGSGFTQEQRVLFWKTKDLLIGKIIKYKFQPAGVKEKPRFPTFASFRDERDL